jgi:ribosomal protein S18 acetylase RimI-like enzyme
VILVRDEPLDLKKYQQIPISFEVSAEYTIEELEKGINHHEMIEIPVDKPYLKNYDSYESPVDWLKFHDTTNWGMLMAYIDKLLVGGVILAWKSTDVNMLESRDDLVVVWDIRIVSEYRGLGIGRKLFDEVTEWCKKRNVKEIKIETQNNNIGACKFYSKLGAQLSEFNVNAYPELPGEHQLIWRYFI